MSAVIENINEELLMEFPSASDKGNLKFKSIMDNIEFLNLPKHDTEALTKYKDLIKDKYNIQEHTKVIRALRSNDVIHSRLEVARISTYGVKVMHNGYNAEI